MQSLISKEHRCNCLTACQKCLLTYSNRGFHHILDWRLGIGLLHLMLDENYDFGFDASQRGNYEEMADFGHIVQECAKKYNLSGNANGDYCWIDKNGLCTVFYHPLWNKKKVIENVSEGYSGLRMFNTFKVLRSDLTEDTDENNTTRPIQRTNILNRIKNNSRTFVSIANPQLTDKQDENDDDDIIL